MHRCESFLSFFLWANSRCLVLDPFLQVPQPDPIRAVVLLHHGHGLQIRARARCELLRRRGVGRDVPLRPGFPSSLGHARDAHRTGEFLTIFSKAASEVPCSLPSRKATTKAAVTDHGAHHASGVVNRQLHCFRRKAETKSTPPGTWNAATSPCLPSFHAQQSESVVFRLGVVQKEFRKRAKKKMAQAKADGDAFMEQIFDGQQRAFKVCCKMAFI